ncbi:hypothetical protein MKW98_016800 [Papaver atlanticum]|uniref:Uncharacterized protein n=1 Tax=Papaver atlanticum TaxID=357466 RepID=A0AAD4TLF6_9MAGN|nr:hypothetical protein MKW98_016800 [Papaver atlanticum]
MTILSAIPGEIINRFIHFGLLFLVFHNCYAIDNSSIITPTQTITDSQTLTSAGHVFKLGFFSPPDSTNRYVGIWYEYYPRTIVWVANRNNPLKDSSGTLRIADDGNLVIADAQGVVFWTTNVSNITTPDNLVAELMDSGNLEFKVLNDDSKLVWQSFDHPTHTFLPGMKIELTSWKSESDPSTGIFSVGLELLDDNNPQLVLWRNGSKFWRSGPWNNIIFIGVAEMPLANAFYSFNQEESLYISFRDINNLNTRFVLDHHGTFLGKERDVNLNNLSELWSSQSNSCGTYRMCGAFGSCSSSNSPICSCLTGFRPKFEDEWSNGNWSGGCVRITQLECQNSSFRNSDTVDGFQRLESMKVPDYASFLLVTEMEECKMICLKNCSCLAYSHESGIGCMTWGGNLVDIQKFTQRGTNIYVRLARSCINDLALKNSTDPARTDNTYLATGGFKNKVLFILIIPVLVGTLAISICTYFFCNWLKRGKVVSDLNNTQEETPDNPDQVKVFKFQELAIAITGANMLGQGGFGQVYKAWQLWNESKLELLIDPMILHESTPLAEIFRCIQVGLLCAQECARDRPTMSTTLSMLTSEITTLPTLKQPAFIERRVSMPLDSANHLTITNIEGR